jgi:hypothetical protein
MGNNRRFYVSFFGMDNDAFRRFLAVAMGAVMSYRTDDDGLPLVFVTDIVIETMSAVGVGEIGNSRGFYFNFLGMKRGEGGMGFCVYDVALTLLFCFLSSVLLLALCLY